MTIYRLWRSYSTAPLFDQHFGFEKGADIVGALVDHAHFHGLNALIARRGIKVQTIAASMKIGAAILAGLSKLDLIRNLDLPSAVVAAGDQVKTRLDAASGPFGARRRLRFPLPVFILIAVLTILSGHFLPQQYRLYWIGE